MLRRAEAYSAEAELVTRLPDRSFQRTTYGESCRRARALGVGLKELGLERGDRVATLCWNHLVHHEAYLGIPCGGFVLHTLNLRLHPNDLAYIATHANDRAVIVDRSLVPLLDQFRERTNIEHVLVVEDGYEELVAGADPDAWEDPRARRERSRCDVLHERHDRPAEGRALLAPLDDAPHARRRGRQPDGARHLGAGRDPARRADVPCERLGLPVPGDDARREARLPGAVPRPGEPARRVRVGERDVDGRRADDLARHPPAARRESRAAGTSRT